MHEYTITALEPQKNSKRRYNLYLDGEYKCGITEDSVAVFRLKAGQTLTESKLREIMDTTETQIAFDKCLNLLGKSMKTTKQIKEYLQQKGFGDRVSQNVINKLKEYKYIDDQAYAVAFVSQFKTCKGAFRIRQELMLKGIKKEIIDEALSDIDENEKVENAFNLAKKAVKGKPIDQKQLIKVNRHLLSRGFDFETVNVVLNRLKTENGFSDDTEE